MVSERVMKKKWCLKGGTHTRLSGYATSGISALCDIIKGRFNTDFRLSEGVQVGLMTD